LRRAGSWHEARYSPVVSRFPRNVAALTFVAPSAPLLCAAGLLVISPAESVSASDSVHRSLVVRAEVSPRTSLHTSAEALQFEISDPSLPATASIQFSAGTRTHAAGEVLLIVEQFSMPQRISATSREGDSDPVATTDSGSDDAVDVSAPGRKVAKRWIGSGLRSGKIDFILRASEPGLYDVPVRFVLSAP
jgi:hypothetical protein